jgi:hypothetical protein
MSTHSSVHSFNDRLHEFLNELVTTFPEIKDLKLLRSSFTLLKNIDASAPQKMFNTHVVQRFGDKIRQRDESFFLTYDYTDVVNDIPGVEANQSLDIVGHLKDIWHALDSTNKDAIWTYLAVLLLLNNKCQSSK